MAISDRDRLSDLKFEICVVNNLFAYATQPQITRSVVSSDGARRESRLDRVIWCYYDHVRQRAHYRNILRCMMAHSQRTVRHTAADRNNLDVGLVVAHIISNLFQTPQYREIGD